jgi:hypothetical protein
MFALRGPSMRGERMADSSRNFQQYLSYSADISLPLIKVNKATPVNMLRPHNTLRYQLLRALAVGY